MEIRLKFLPGDQEKFLLQVTKQSGLSTDRLAGLTGVTPRSYRDWKRGRLNMSLKAAEVFCEEFRVVLPERKEALMTRWKKAKLEASRKGGIALFQKYGSPGTNEGRKKGGRKALSILRAKGIIPYPKEYSFPRNYSEELAEFIGIMLGDGSLTPGQSAITLNAKADREYIPFVVELGGKLFGEKPKISRRKDSKAITVYYNGVKLVDYLVSIGLRIGNKVKNQVGVPKWIERRSAYKIACMRGLMDTDGGIFLHRYKVTGKEYAYQKLSFSNRSLPLLWFVAKALRGLSMNPKVVDKVENKKLWLYNKDEVRLYLALVGTHNPRLLKHQKT